VTSRRQFIGRLGAVFAGGCVTPGLLLAARPPRFALGIDVLAADRFRAVQGGRIGLLTHPAGRNGAGQPTIDVLRAARQVNLVALFGPEHGIYGDEKANVPVEDRIDQRTGLPVYSLYGRFRRPTPAMLDRIDVMVIDLQDIGARSYTYISCMRYVLEACFAAGKAVVVLDRPNPLGGLKIDGPGLEPAWGSYVGAFPVPYVHGLTIGELARWAQRVPGILPLDDTVRRAGRLTVVPMAGWTRAMQWPATGLAWHPTSPAIPDLSAVLGYPMVGLGCQLGGFSHGYGTRLPFRLLQFKGRTPEQIAAALTARRIPGLRFEVVPLDELGAPRRATYVVVDDWQALRPTELNLHLLALAAEWGGPGVFAATTAAQRDLFNKHFGEAQVMDDLVVHGPAIDIDHHLRRWAADCRQFERGIRPHYLYE
jgi:uncharacterized protein YbbC (DUF1343 family)